MIILLLTITTVFAFYLYITIFIQKFEPYVEYVEFLEKIDNEEIKTIFNKVWLYRHYLLQPNDYAKLQLIYFSEYKYLDLTHRTLLSMYPQLFVLKINDSDVHKLFGVEKEELIDILVNKL